MNAPPPVAGTPGAIARQRAEQYDRLKGLQLAKADLDEERARPSHEEIQELLGEMMSAVEVAKMPPPVPLINGLLDLDSAAWLIGKAGSYKSFVAIDFAGHVGRGMEWHGRRVRQGTVVYIVAEGLKGVGLRLNAWQATHGPMENVHFLPRPVLVDERGPNHEWTVLIEACAYLQAKFVIIDTQSRVSGGLQENSNDDMNYLARQVDRMKAATAGCVLVLHHIGRNGTDARGGSALDGAQDTELTVDKTAGLVAKLRQTKQKDGEEGEPIPLKLLRVEGGVDPGTGRDLSSLVVSAEDAPVNLGRPTDAGNQRAVVKLAEVVAEVFPKVGCTKSELKAAVKERDVMSQSTFYRAWDTLLAGKHVARRHDAEKWVYVPPEGRDALTEPVGREDEPAGFYLPYASKDGEES